MESIIVEVTVPTNSTTYDFALPAHGTVEMVVREMIRILETAELNISFSLKADQDRPVLCDLDRELMLSAGQTLAQAGVHDGSRLLLL